MESGQVLVSLDPDVSAQRLVDLLVRLRGRSDLNVLVLE
jgi:biopolymer transport protein ExbD